MWLSDFRIVLPDRVIERGALQVQGGVITAVSETPVDDAALRGDGLLLMPGMIDIHGDMIERDVEPRPNVRMPMELGLRDLDRKLASSGVTTAYAALSFSPGSTYGHLRSYEHTSDMIRSLRGARDALLIDHRIHARFEVTFPKALDVVGELIAEGSVDLISLCDHTPGQGQYRDLERYTANLARSKKIALEEAAVAVSERISERTRPAAEMASVLAAIAGISRSHGVALASHDDDTPAKVSLMRDIGASISEFPVTLEAAQAAREAGMLTVMGAPNALRGLSYSGNLSAREAHAEGLLDVLAADYHPTAMLPAVLALAGEDPGGLAGAARLVTANPARVLGLHDRGEIARGKQADLIVADASGVGHVRMTIRRGRVVYSDGSLAASATST